MTVNLETVCCPLCGSDKGDPLFEWRTRRMVRCAGCSLVYRNPRPTVADVRGAYAAARSSLELEERVGGRRSHQFRRFLDSFPERPGRLLDVGCGYGFFLKMAEEKGWEAVGVDLDPNGIAYAKEHLRVNALLGDIRDIQFPEGHFDLVTLWNVLDHSPDPVDVLAETHRLLKENGHVFIRTPNVTWQYLSFRLAKFLKHLGWGGLFEDRPYTTFIFHLTNFSRSTLRLLLDRSGFVSISIRNSPPIPGDPYLGFGPTRERLVSLGKRAVHGTAQAWALLSGGRWLIGPSLEAWGRRGKIPDSLVAVQREPVQGKRRMEEFR